MMKAQRYVGVLVKYKNSVLLCKRNNKGDLPGQFSIPAGKIEKGERIMNAAKREFYEETGIDIENEDLRLISAISRSTRDGKKVKGLMYVYLLESDVKLIPDLENSIDGDEHTMCGYYTVNNIPDPIESNLFELIEVILR
jgi:ADP-ribose pyrophosphatase YjhB (NUDIX family)